MNTFKRLLATLAIVTMLVAPATYAQDDTPTPETTVEPTPAIDETPIEEPDVPPVLEAPTIEELLSAVETTLLAILAGVIASPVTSAAVSIVKWIGDRFGIVLIKNATGSQLNTVMVVILVGAVWIARFFGVAASLNSAFAIILALAPILAGVAVGARASSGVYGNVTRGKVALVGYERASERRAYKEYTPAAG